jgi:hypothetical protein
MARKTKPKYPPRTPEDRARISASLKAYHAKARIAIAIVEKMGAGE